MLFRKNLSPSQKSIEQHIANLRRVLVRLHYDCYQMKHKDRRGVKFNFGDYTCPINSFDNNDGWIVNGYKEQKKVLTVYGKLRLSIAEQQKRLHTLLRMQKKQFITEQEHQFLLKITALNQDPYIVNYSQVMRRLSLSL